MRRNRSAYTCLHYFALAILAVFLCTISGCSNQNLPEGAACGIHELSGSAIPELAIGKTSTVTLYKNKTNVPFEWLDYETAQVVEDGKLALNVNNNELANGKYAEGKVMLVANPRQFRKIDGHPGGSYMQNKDIDFAGSCAIKVIGSPSIERMVCISSLVAQLNGRRTKSAYLTTLAIRTSHSFLQKARP